MTNEETFARFIADTARELADQLRHTADRIEQHVNTLPKVGQPGVESYATIAAIMQGEVRSLLGNLGVERLTRDAYLADSARLAEAVPDSAAA